MNAFTDAEREATLRRREATLTEMAALREKAIQKGMKLLSEDEILHEVARRRGEDQSNGN